MTEEKETDTEAMSLSKQEGIETSEEVERQVTQRNREGRSRRNCRKV